MVRTALEATKAFHLLWVSLATVNTAKQHRSTVLTPSRDKVPFQVNMFIDWLIPIQTFSVYAKTVLLYIIIGTHIRTYATSMYVSIDYVCILCSSTETNWAYNTLSTGTQLHKILLHGKPLPFSSINSMSKLTEASTPFVEILLPPCSHWRSTVGTQSQRVSSTTKWSVVEALVYGRNQMFTVQHMDSEHMYIHTWTWTYVRT